MSTEEHKESQRLRELEWLTNYFKEHGREDLAQEIFQQVRKVRQRAQNALSGDVSDVIDINSKRKKADNSEFGKD